MDSGESRDKGFIFLLFLRQSDPKCQQEENKKVKKKRGQSFFY